MYQKPYLTISEQIELLEQRGLIIADKTTAERYLENIGYYRLSAYWYPFRSASETIQPNGKPVTLIESNFKPDVSFENIIDLYHFDKGLRTLLLEILDQIEISLRTSVSLELGKYDPYAYRNPQYMDKKFINHQDPQKTHASWLNNFDQKSSRSKETFAEHFRHKYPGSSFPIWMAVELLEFGPLSILLKSMRFKNRRYIAQKYGIQDPQYLTSWIHVLCDIRNICAHHARLWNRNLVNQPRLPSKGSIQPLDHLHTNSTTQQRLYSALAIGRFFLRTIDPQTKWPQRLKAHIKSFPQNPYIALSDSGFTQNWDSEDLWS